MRGNRDGGDFQKELLPGKRTSWSRRSQAGLCAVKPAFAAPFWADVGTERIKRTATSARGMSQRQEAMKEERQHSKHRATGAEDKM